MSASQYDDRWDPTAQRAIRTHVSLPEPRSNAYKADKWRLTLQTSCSVLTYLRQGK
jgi:hypothetical protein